MENGTKKRGTTTGNARDRAKGHAGKVSGRADNTIVEQATPVGKLLSEVEPESVEWLWPGLTDVRGADADRMLFTGRSEDFDWITDAGCRAAADNPDNLFGGVLALLAECRAERHAAISETRGASYAQLRAVSDALGMTPTKDEDCQLLAESLTLTERHVLCILGALAEAAA